MKERKEPVDKLLNRSFVSIVIVQIASLFGDAVLRFALPLYVLNVTGSAALTRRVLKRGLPAEAGAASGAPTPASALEAPEAGA